MRSLQQSVIDGLQSLCGEDTFIKINDSILPELEFPNHIFDLLAPVLIFNFFVRVNKFHLLDLLSLDLMNAVHLA